MNHVRFQLAWELLDNECIVRTFVDANSASNTEAFRNMRLSCFLIENNAFLTVTNRWTKGVTLIVALLWLTIVFFEDCDSHSFTSCSVMFAFGSDLRNSRPISLNKRGLFDIGLGPNGFQMSPLRCSCPLIRRTVQGVGNFMLALRSASRAVR